MSLTRLRFSLHGPAAVSPRKPRGNRTVVSGKDLALPGVERRTYLIVFVRDLHLGCAKTKMFPAPAEKEVESLQRDLALHALSNVAQLVKKRRVTVEVHHTGGTASQMKEAFGQRWTYVSQIRGDRGARINAAIRRGFDRGASSVALMETDCPDLGAETIAEALDRAQHADVVFVPTTDGGYALVAIGRSVPEMFSDRVWGTKNVMRESIRAAGRAGFTVEQLDPIPHVATPGDLAVWRRADEARRNDRVAPRISVIVPTLNESFHITRTLSRARTGRGVEILVVDGGSHDDTAAKAATCGATVLRSDPGRARQMNAGAARATGDVLLFLHADTLLPPGFDCAIRHAMTKPGAVGGAFRFGIDAPGFLFRVIERAVALRCRVGQRPYGDQALFVARTAFDDVGGYLDQPILEDCDLVRALRRRGRIVLLRPSVRTSARRWVDNGIVRTTLCHQFYLVARALGVSPRTIATWRGRQRSPSTQSRPA